MTLLQKHRTANQKKWSPFNPIKEKPSPVVSIPDDIPCEEIVYDLPDDQKTCPHDGTELKVIGSEDHKRKRQSKHTLDQFGIPG